MIVIEQLSALFVTIHNYLAKSSSPPLSALLRLCPPSKKIFTKNFVTKSARWPYVNVLKVFLIIWECYSYYLLLVKSSKKDVIDHLIEFGAIIIHHRRIVFFSATEHQMNPGPVCKFQFCRCGPVEKKNRALYLSRFSRGGPTKSFR